MAMSRMKKAKPDPVRQHKTSGLLLNGPGNDVLTLAEAAAYLRLPEEDVLRLVQQQDLPGRQLANEWRFLKAAIQHWLGTSPRGNNEGIWAAAGSLRDDPYLEEMLKSIDRMRGKADGWEG
jgi:excisionase family DNA binding protein